MTAAICLRESSIPFSEIGGDGKRSSIQLINQEAMPARKHVSRRANGFGEVERLLIDEQLFETERHDRLELPFRRHAHGFFLGENGAIQGARFESSSSWFDLNSNCCQAYLGFPSR